MPAPDCDVLVIGAGIHGAGIAQASAAAGHAVVLVEQYDAPARGTSSRSSKLIHGGLRYLEHGQIGLVRECLRERALLLRLAPQLVHLTPFHLPVYADARRGPLTIGAGLALYGLLALGGPGAGFARVARRDWAALDGLDTRALRAVYRYHDAQTDDAALTGAVLASARALGATVHFGTTLVAAQLTSAGVRADLGTPDGPRALTARVLVNAAGPWAADLAARIHPCPALPPVRLVGGSHVLLPGRLDAGAYTLQAPDGRVVFALPHPRGILVGTTEMDYIGDPAGVAPTAAEIAYLRGAFARALPGHPAAQAQPLESFAGLRVLPAGGSAHAAPRETLLPVDDPRRVRVLTVLGGKLTAYRATAARVLARIAPSLPARPPRADTRTLPLPP